VMDRSGNQYDLAFESDGSPITVKGPKDERISQSLSQAPAPPTNNTPLPKLGPDISTSESSATRKTHVGKWYTDDPAACAGDLPEGGGLLVYSARDVSDYESSCRITDSVSRGDKTDLTMRCSAEGKTSAALNRETVELVGDKLKRTFRDGRSQRTLTYNRCSPRWVQGGEKLSYGSKSGMTVTVVSLTGINSNRAIIRTKHTKEDAMTFCRDYVGKVTEKCIRETLTTPIADAVTGDCLTGRFTNFYREDHQFLGETKSKSEDLMARYVIKNIATGQIADGSNGSGYPTNMQIFGALCPLKAPTDD
jgi:hypothetical protein